MSNKDQYKAMFYSDRKHLLANTDYVSNIAIEFLARSTVLPKKYIDLIEYRQKLRDLPEQEGFNAQDPDSYNWPDYPKA